MSNNTEVNTGGGSINMSGSAIGSNNTVTGTATQTDVSNNAETRTDTIASIKSLIDELRDELQKVPVEKSEEAEAVAETAQQAIDQAQKEQPNKTLLKITAEGLKKAAENLAAVVPSIMPIATQIAAHLGKL